jgi:hypothetical protein
MAPIFPEVANDSACSSSLAEPARFCGVGLRSTAGISKGGDMIYINGQTHANLVKMVTDTAIYENSHSLEILLDLNKYSNPGTIATDAWRQNRNFYSKITVGLSVSILNISSR